MRQDLAVAIVCTALASGAGCGSSGKAVTTDGGSGNVGAAGTTGAGGTGAAGTAGATGAAGTTGTAGTTGAAGTAGSGGGSVDAGSSHSICHSNAECTPPEVCYIGASSGGCAGPAGQCVRMTSPCNGADKCACLDVPSGSCTSVAGSQGCLEQGTATSCWACILPV